MTCLLAALALASLPFQALAEPRYTTRGPDIVDTRTNQPVILRGFGLGGWLLPEGYMWGIRKLDRPRQFEAAIVDLIGETDAAEFWRLYHENYVTEADIAAMKAWGANSVRIPLLASMLQPRDGQPEPALDGGPPAPPYRYNEAAFAILDRLVDWCERHELGVIWDMHAAPGGQNAENISDADGTARLWTERERYWPQCIDLWMQIVRRYNGRDCIIGYDLLNEPLLRRYDGIDPALLRLFYVTLTRQIRTVDARRLIFIEGDDWAQEFAALEPLDWDPHLVVAFHSYPPTADPPDLARWERLRRKYNVPLWHGETGEVGPPFTVNRMSTEFLEQANVGWSWWTHKKLGRITQPWVCVRTPGFLKILDYWNERGPRPSREQAREWLFEQARQTNSRQCVFVPEMVRSLGLNPDAAPDAHPPSAPEFLQHPVDASVEEGGAVEFLGLARGDRLRYEWLRDGTPMPDESAFWLRLSHLGPADDGAAFALRASSAAGVATSSAARLTVRPFSGPLVPRTAARPRVDGDGGETGSTAARLTLDNVVIERGAPPNDPAPVTKLLWDQDALYLRVEVVDAVLFSAASVVYENDGVEVFLDGDNSKSQRYGAGDLHLRYAFGAAAVEAPDAARQAGLRAAQSKTSTGYAVEFAIPWAALSISPHAGRFIGLDVHVNDNDGHGRTIKRAWRAQRDDAHLAPARLGTVRLTED